MKRSSNDPADRRDENLRPKESRVKENVGETVEEIVEEEIVEEEIIEEKNVENCYRPDFATRLTLIVTEAEYIREALELAATELSNFLSLLLRIVFTLFRAFSLLWLFYLIFVKHWRPGGIGGFVVSALSIVVFLDHCMEIANRLLRGGRK